MNCMSSIKLMKDDVFSAPLLWCQLLCHDWKIRYYHESFCHIGSLLACSYPEMFVKMDKFRETSTCRMVRIAWKSFNEVIDELVWYAPALESKNTGALYNYRVDDLFQFAHEAKEILSQVPALKKITKRRQKKWVNENSHYLEVMVCKIREGKRQFKDLSYLEWMIVN